LHDPEILILDEPTDGLDPNQKHEIRSLIQEMAPRKAIIISTHILEEVDAVCTRAIIISRGRIVANGTPEELVSRSDRHKGVAISATRETCEQLISDLNALDGVASVEMEARGLFVKPEDREHDILDPVRVLVRQRGVSVNDIRVERGRLEDVFRDVTTPAEGGDAR
ncbi:MAG TPA: ABC transporter ATP-binding protein, partial [Alphaproteobacteria bacterium]|nr:ABC transporter ATP-binding protein [Alphaproteobacteria bacterium]